MIINLIIKHSKTKDSIKPVYKANIKKIRTTNTFVDRTICACGAIYPKVLEIEEGEHLIPVELNYKEEFEVVIEAGSSEELKENIIAFLLQKLNCKVESVQHGAEESVSRVYGGLKSCLPSEQEGRH